MNLIELLDQDEIWVDKQGDQHLIADMDAEYAANIVRFLMRQVQDIAFAAAFAMASMPMPQGEIAYNAVDSDITRETEEIIADPKAWLWQKPLLEALADRVGGQVQLW